MMSLRTFADAVASGRDVIEAWNEHRHRMKTRPLHACAAMMLALESTKEYLDARADAGHATESEIELLREVCGALLLAGEV